jgi:hypothetical protein
MAKAKLTIDPAIPAAMQKKLDSGKEHLSKGVELPLSKSDKSKVIFTKMESKNPLVSDTQHTGDWHIQAVAHEKLSLLGRINDEEEIGITEDDGIILDFKGTPAAEIAIDLRSNRIMTDAEAETEEETLGTLYPRFTRFDFCLEKVTITDGPSRRQKLVQSADQERLEGETNMFATMEKFFGRMMGMQTSMAAAQAGKDFDPSKFFSEAVADMTPEQIEAQAQMKEIEEEDAELNKAIEAGKVVEFEPGGADKGKSDK